MRTHLPRLYLLLPVMLLLASAVVVGCGYGYGGASPATSTPTSGPASGNSVTISNFSFSPPTLTVKAGATVTWTNQDSVTHTITSDNGVFDSGNLAPNAKYSHTFGTAGTFPYHCSIHPYMKGTITTQ